jgi:hypothetical protein
MKREEKEEGRGKGEEEISSYIRPFLTLEAEVYWLF